MPGSEARLLIVIGLVAAAACKGGKGGGSDDVELVLAHRDRQVPVTVAVPDGWVESPHGSQEFRPDDHRGQPGVASWTVSTDCYGACDEAAIAGNMRTAIKGRKRTATRVVAQAGGKTPVANLEVIAEEDLESGQLLAYRVTYPGEVPKRQRERVSVYCTHARPGDDFFVVFEATAPLSDEDRYLEDFLAVCESVRVGDAEGS